MRFEQRVCDLCGHRSDLHLVHDATARASTVRPWTMAQRGWTVIAGGLDRCADCTWMDRQRPEETRP